jgi:hypothetical protein
VTVVTLASAFESSDDSTWVASPVRATIPMRAHISWTAVISGKDRIAVQSGRYPNEAPATEYVETPDGSSSAAPVIRPGPRSLKKCFS